jgi:hypothetical protein
MTRTVTADNAFPLRWPPGQPRTLKPRRASFKITAGDARKDLLYELYKLGARGVVLSTNVPLRRDGLPYADGDPADAGVAVYFELPDDRGVMVEHEIACDAWDRVKDNMRAIGLTVQAIRGVERWGSTSLMRRVFSAFRMLPAAGNGARPWREVLHASHPGLSLADVKGIYRRLAAEIHPDRGGAHEQMAELNAAMVAAERELGNGAP